MSREISSYVSSVSAMLAAYAFFFNAFKDRIDKANDVESPSQVWSTWESQVKAVDRGRRAALWLAIIPLLVWTLFTDKIEDALVHSSHDIDEYETLDVLFFVLANAWLVIAVVVGVRWWALRKSLLKFKQKEPEKP